MAEISFDGVDDIVRTMTDFNLFDEETQTELLTAGASHIRTAIQGLLSKLSNPRKIKRDKDGNFYVTITVSGKNERGERNATVLFVLNYGRSEPYGKIQGSYFWTRAVQRSQRSLISVYERIINDKLDERSLV